MRIRLNKLKIVRFIRLKKKKKKKERRRKCTVSLKCLWIMLNCISGPLFYHLKKKPKIWEDDARRMRRLRNSYEDGKPKSFPFRQPPYTIVHPTWEVTPLWIPENMSFYGVCFPTRMNFWHYVCALFTPICEECWF